MKIRKWLSKRCLSSNFTSVFKISLDVKNKKLTLNSIYLIISYRLTHTLKSAFLSFQLLKIGEHQLVLQRVTLQSSGVYSCQITLSGPPFDTVNKEKTLSVYGKFIFIFVLNLFYYTVCNENYLYSSLYCNSLNLSYRIINVKWR